MYPPLFFFPDKVQHAVEFIEARSVSVGTNSRSSGNSPAAFGIYSRQLTIKQYNVGLIPTSGGGQPAVDMSVTAIGRTQLQDSHNNSAEAAN